jgi:hypothetical protein
MNSENNVASRIVSVHDQVKSEIRGLILSMMGGLSANGLINLLNDLMAIKEAFANIDSENVSTFQIASYLGALEIDLILAEWMQRNPPETDGK